MTMTPVVALHQRHVRQVEAPDLVDPVAHLVEALAGASWPWRQRLGCAVSGHSPCQEAVGVVVPDHPARRVGDHARVERPDEAPVGVLEVRAVVEGEVGGGGVAHGVSQPDVSPWCPGRRPPYAEAGGRRPVAPPTHVCHHREPPC